LLLVEMCWVLMFGRQELKKLLNKLTWILLIMRDFQNKKKFKLKTLLIV